MRYLWSWRHLVATAVGVVMYPIAWLGSFELFCLVGWFEGCSRSPLGIEGIAIVGIVMGTIALIIHGVATPLVAGLRAINLHNGWVVTGLYAVLGYVLVTAWYLLTSEGPLIAPWTSGVTDAAAGAALGLVVWTIFIRRSNSASLTDAYPSALRASSGAARRER